MADINPFEPWRPHPDKTDDKPGATPEMLHPWRPLVEPAKSEEPPRRTEPAEPTWSAAPRPEPASPEPGPSPAARGSAAVFALLTIVTAVLLFSFGAMHLWRVAAVMTAVWVGAGVLLAPWRLGAARRLV